MRALYVLNLLLLAASWLLALLGAWASLITGLTPVLGLAVVVGWALLTGLMYRVAHPRSGRHGWRLVLPALWLLLSYGCFSYGIVRLRERYAERQGFPRRYYTWPQ